jgi:hypothetical protein
MATKNDITGAEIKSGILSTEGRSNWDKAFSKKSVADWLHYEDNNNAAIIANDTPVSYKEFCELLNKYNMNLENEKKTLKEWKREYGLADQDVLTNPLLEEIEAPNSEKMTRSFFEQVYNIFGTQSNGSYLI